MKELLCASSQFATGCRAEDLEKCQRAELEVFWKEDVAHRWLTSARVEFFFFHFLFVFVDSFFHIL